MAPISNRSLKWRLSRSAMPGRWLRSPEQSKPPSRLPKSCPCGVEPASTGACEFSETTLCSTLIARLANQNSRASRPSSKLSRNREPAHPDNLVSANNHRPQPALRFLHFKRLQKLLHLLWSFRVRGPKPVSRTPVPHPQRPAQKLAIE